MGGGGLYFQKNSVDLFLKFNVMVRESSLDVPYVIAVPGRFLSISKNKLKEEKKYKAWRFTRYVYDCYFKKKSTIYLDSFLFRENSQIDNNVISKLWKDERFIIFVHNNYKYFCDFKSRYEDKETAFVQITSSNSYQKYSEILESIELAAVKLSKNKKDICILASAGPTGKVLTYDLSYLGYRVLDMGHYFDYKFYEIRRDEK